MTKKLTATLLAALVAFGAWAETETVDGIEWTYRVVDGKAEIYNNGSAAILDTTSGAITIPSTLGGKPVTSIGNAAFYECYDLTSITIPNSVTNIGEQAFECCDGLTSITIGNSVTNIGNYAFEDCNGLASVTIPDSVMSIGVGAFSGCSGLTSVTMPDSVTSIGSSAFRDCSGLTSLKIPDSVARIGSSAFAGCNSALFDTTTIVGVMLVDGWAVGTTGSPSGNLDLSGVRGIGCEAFYNCSRLASVTIPNSVTSIGLSAFSGCSGLTAVHVTDLAAWCRISFENSGWFADNDFYYANPLYYARNLYLNGVKVEDLTIPDGVTSIGEGAFVNCSGITSVTIPDSVTSIGDHAFSGCSGLTSVTIPDSVTSIGGYAFAGCSGLTNVTIPDSITSFSTTAFDGCGKLWTAWYRTLANASAGTGGGSSSVVTTVVQQVAAPYALTSAPADRAIASVMVDGDCAIDKFVLKNGEVYDSILRIVNTADHDVKLTLPTGYSYETFEGVDPLTIPASSRNLLSITRTADKTFLVSREKLKTVQ